MKDIVHYLFRNGLSKVKKLELPNDNIVTFGGINYITRKLETHLQIEHKLN